MADQENTKDTTMKTSRSDKLQARYRPISRISVVEIRQMYQVFQAYYAHTDIDTFLEDLSKKSGVILIRTRAEKRVVGFSTIVSMPMTVGGLKGQGIFSGDTIIEREYWGTRSLQLAFYRYVIREKLRKPLRPLFWLLISKGYKTYLLLANNFERYYPHPENHYPELDGIVRHYCEELFPGSFDNEKGILDFGDMAQCLKEGVAGVTEDLRETHPKIRFFEECNPTWMTGTELPCVGVINARALANFALKAIRQPTAGARAAG